MVSLCRLGTLDVPGVAPEDHARFWVIDSAVEGDNAHAAFVLHEAAAAVETLPDFLSSRPWLGIGTVYSESVLRRDHFAA